MHTGVQNEKENYKITVTKGEKGEGRVRVCLRGRERNGLSELGGSV